jgi:hypothetical protein
LNKPELFTRGGNCLPPISEIHQPILGQIRLSTTFVKNYYLAKKNIT